MSTAHEALEDTMVEILYDGPNALVTSRVLVIRTRPPQTLWTNRINEPRVVPQPLSPAQTVLIHALGVMALLILAAWPTTRRPEAFTIGAAVMAVTSVALAATHRRRPRRYTLRCVYEDRCVDLLTGTNRNELVRIARAIQAAYIQDVAAHNPLSDAS